MPRPPRTLSTLRCSGCHLRFPREHFRRDPSRGTGRASRCASCDRAHGAAAGRAWYARLRREDPAALRHLFHERDRRRLADPVQGPRLRARWEWRKHVRAHPGVKGTTCWDCGGAFPPEKLHGHHPDHRYPLEVEILCARCHGRRHRKERGDRGREVAA